ncbi:MAG: glycosyltransferase family 4 protein [Caldilineaceae bacterium]|nr:glycosyltransferase family 4 protein [Caldilineaceae bacterium]
MMRVLQIAFNSAELCVYIANALALESDVCLMLPRDQAEPCIKWLSPAVDFQPFDKPRLRQPWHQITLARTLLKRIDQFNPDVVHLQKGHLYFGLVLPYLRRKYPLVISIHDPRQHIGDKSSRRTPQPLMDFAYRQAHRVIAHNEQMKEMIVKELGIPQINIDVMPLIALGDPDAVQEVESEEKLVLFFGRIWAYKGLAHLIEAEPLITARVPGAKIVIAGQGDDLSPYRRMMVNPANFIVYNDWISNEQRADLFSRASVIVLPYIEATQSGVIPVAYTHAKPVVATSVGGLPTQVEEGHTGFLVPPGDVEALADRVVQLLQDKALSRQLGLNGKHKLDTEWSGPVLARQMVAVYHKAIDTVQTQAVKRQGVAPLAREK